MTPEQRRGSKIKEWREHPAIMVRELFGIEPDLWQLHALEAFPHNPRIAFLSCKGPGKTAVLAWIGWNFLITRKNANVGAISITGKNLQDGLWKEMAKWRERSDLIKRAFTWTQSRIFNNDSPATWFMSAKSWSQSASKEEQANALAGFHEDNILFLIDESGSMTDAVMVSAEAALSSAVDGHIVQAGNPTNLEGPLYRAHKHRDLWHVIEITADPDDPNRTPRISVEYARSFIQHWGRDNPWTQVNIFGRFPPGSINALISREDAEAAAKRYWRLDQIGVAAKILGVDVARYGDDSSVIMPRHGIQAFPIIKHRNIDSNQGAGIVTREWDKFGADAVFVDDTGGFGAGWIDNLRRLGRQPIGVGFARQAHNPVRYENKRAEMYLDTAEWIKAGGAIPDIPELVDALCTTTYTAPRGRLILEPKAMIKARLGYSPDEADALALTFAEPVTPMAAKSGSRPRHQFSYDPMSSFDAEMDRLIERENSQYR